MSNFPGLPASAGIHVLCGEKNRIQYKMVFWGESALGFFVFGKWGKRGEIVNQAHKFVVVRDEKLLASPEFRKKPCLASSENL